MTTVLRRETPGRGSPKKIKIVCTGRGKTDETNKKRAARKKEESKE